MRGIRRRGITAAAAVAIAGMGSAVAAQAAGQLPVLAGPWSHGQKGYGTVKPHTIFNGGDPTGLVKDISWSSWGGPKATGTGSAIWVGPHQSVAQGTLETGVKVVLFQLGTCKGKPAYDAIEWFFPRHGQHFKPGSYINACTGTYYDNGKPEG